MKKTLLVAIVWVLVVGFLLSLMPWHRNIFVQTTAYEYALDQQEPLRTHEVKVEGRYYLSIWKENRYEGVFSISGLPETIGQTARVDFFSDANYSAVFYRNSEGYVRGVQGYLCANRDFTEFCFLVIDPADSSPGNWNSETGHVICPAADYDAMTAMRARIEGWSF